MRNKIGSFVLLLVLIVGMSAPSATFAMSSSANIEHSHIECCYDCVDFTDKTLMVVERTFKNTQDGPQLIEVARFFANAEQEEICPEEILQSRQITCCSFMFVTSGIQVVCQVSVSGICRFSEYFNVMRCLSCSAVHSRVLLRVLPDGHRTNCF